MATPYAVVTPANQHSSKWALHWDGGAIESPALQWVVTGVQVHADKAIETLNAEGSPYQNMEVGVYSSLTTGWQDPLWMAAAETIHY